MPAVPESNENSGRGEKAEEENKSERKLEQQVLQSQEYKAGNNLEAVKQDEQLHSLDGAPNAAELQTVNDDSRFKSKFDRTDPHTEGDGSVQTSAQNTMDARQVSIVVAQGEGQRKSVMVKRGHANCSKNKHAATLGSPYVLEDADKKS